MSPRRGGSSSYYSYYDSSSRSVWGEEILLSVEYWPSKGLFYAAFVFDILTLAALITFTVWACLIRNHRGQLRGVVATLSAWLVATTLYVIYEILFVAEATVTNYYVIVLILNVFFGLLRDCLLLFVFYNLVRAFLNRLTDVGKPYAAVTIIHWVILGLLSALSITSWAMYVAYEVKFVQSETDLEFIHTYIQLESARAIIFWIASLEVLVWAIFVTAKAYRFISKTPAISLLLGSLFYFAYNLMYTIVDIRYSLESGHLTPAYLSTATSVCQFFFCIAIIVGILLCCQNWRKLDGVYNRKSGVQHSESAPTESYRQRQQYHAQQGMHSAQQST